MDLRVVVNPEQANRLLHAVAAQGKRAERMVAFFALMYYAALRPEEATDLHKDNLINLPEEGWGELVKILHHHLTQSWAHPAENGPIFHGPRGGTITDRGTWPAQTP